MPPNLKRRAEAAAHSSKSVKKPRARKSEQPEEGEPTPPSSSKEASRKVAASVDEGGENIEELPDQARKIPENVNGTVAGKPVQEKAKRARKTKEEKEAGLMPLAARTPRLRMFVGAHVSCAKGEGPFIDAGRESRF
jgi:AP endonuclease-1